MPRTIVHLGLGAFHRAHQVATLQRLQEKDDGAAPWRLVSGNIRPGDDVAPALLHQGGAFTLETVDPAGQRAYTVLTALTEAVPYSAGIPALVAAAAGADTVIISFTVTEAGYFLGAGDLLDWKSPALASDLAAAKNGQAGLTIYGALTAALRQRLARDSGPVTLLCCDNLHHNGARFRAGMRQFLVRLDEAPLLAWFDAHTTCPSSMVDRITPRASASLRARVRAATGREDAAAVGCESFLQWIIEDDFCNGRPGWERAGVQMVSDVTPYEDAKIRLLNASHSGIAWAGALLGHTLIDTAASDARVAPLLRACAADVIEVLSPSPVDLRAYFEQVLARFACHAIEDSIERVAADSGAKLAGFIVPTIRQRLQRGLPIDSVAVLPALYLMFLQRWHGGALHIDYRDQALMPAAAAAICEAADPVASLCALPLLWDELAGDPRVGQAVRRALAVLSDSFPTQFNESWK